MCNSELLMDLVSEIIRLSGSSKDLSFTKEDYDKEIFDLAKGILEDMGG